MLFSNLALAKRLERAEGYACAKFAEASRRLHPDNGAEWTQIAGAYAVFNGIDSPVTQSFGLGLGADGTDGLGTDGADGEHEASPLTALDQIERFFLHHATPAVHEVSPYAGVAALDLLCRRNYRPVELSNVLCRPVDTAALQPASPSGSITVHSIAPEEATLWSEISARGWSHNHPELLPFLKDFGGISAVPEPSRVCFLATLEGRPGAAGVLSLHRGVALFGGSSTIAELRRHGLQAALLQARMHYAATHGCDLAMMVAEPGSDSHRNAERQGFQIAYTRTKWRSEP